MSKPAISIKGLSKIYKGGTQALKSVDLEVKQGDFFGLLGANGAGKTTMIGILTGLVKKSKGTVKLFGIDLDKDHNQAKRLMGVVPQEFNFNIFEKVLDIVVQQAGYFGLPRKQALEKARPILEVLDLWNKRSAKAMQLSGGMKRRLMIARALIHEPKLLILDEPTAGVDVELRRGMWDYLRELNKETTILLTTHYLEEAEALCDKIAIIKTGEIVREGSTRQLTESLEERHYVLQLKTNAPTELQVNGYSIKTMGDGRLEISLKADQSLNELINELERQKLTLHDIAPKANRLEQLFMTILNDDEA